MAAQPNDCRVHDALISALSGIKATGFATRGTLSAKDSNIDVGFTVKDIGEIKLPLEPDDAAWDKLREKSRLASQAQGDQQVVNTKDRDTWEFDAAEVSFVKQPLWDSWLNKMVSAVKKNFGIVDDVPVVANPYKLMMYDKGSQVEPRQDTRKALGHFATLPVSLRSNYQGANIRVSHTGQTKTFSTEDQSWGRYQWLAWYTDAGHEVKPLSFGVRLVLTYNLRFTRSPLAYLIYDGQDEVIMQESVKCALERWTGKPTMLWYILEHKYSDLSLNQKLFMNNDALCFNVLETVCQSLGYTILLGQLVHTLSEDLDKGSDAEDDDFEVELCAKHIVHTDGTPYCSRLEMVRSEVAQKDRTFSGPLGAEVIDAIISNRHEWYQNSAILIVPPQSIPEMRVRRWAASEQHPALTHLEQQATLREKGVKSVDPDVRQITKALLND